MMAKMYYVLYNGYGGVAVYDATDEDNEMDEDRSKMTLEQARYIRDEVLNPNCKPRIVRAEPVS